MDERLAPDGTARRASEVLDDLIDRLGPSGLWERQRAAEAEILTMGITFTVYTDGDDIDRAWPFDVIPRVIHTYFRSCTSANDV